ncbi:carbohydrate ABC transporter permease [Demequina mangrovi]|uniref:Carbohydrate ABC transporter membrane protein 2, CUT1 family n=1 Tax=Demequina mangrovi TaxID=1043493 RepID=A0A1H6X292_9MICO|nr:carbohydrate ABC transporter permease [Demequina mangrovi]SEJ18695.1 carbohydrate ABC transporter membrane protein 2, CUT1 family [Demequina mangrovi]
MKRTFLRSAGAALALVLAAVWAFPVYWMVNSSFLTPATISKLEPTWVPFGGTLSNYRAVLADNAFTSALGMSLVVTAICLVLCLVYALLASFAIGRFRFRGRKTFVLAIIVVQMLPAEAMFIAQYKMLAGANLLNSVIGVSVIYLAMVVPFTTWMLRGFVAGIPVDLEEAAMIDGCTRMGAFRRVTFPLLAPGLVASGVFAFLQVWNEFALASIILTESQKATLPLWLRDFAQSSNLGVTEWGEVMAGSVLVAIPVIVFFMIVQGRMAQGLVGGAVKG